MANYSYDPQGIIGHQCVSAGVFLDIHLIDVGGALLRRLLEDGGNPPVGAVAVPVDFRWTRILRSHFHPVGFPVLDYTTLNWRDIDPEYDDELMSVIVIDPAQTTSEPSPTLRSWSDALIGP